MEEGAHPLHPVSKSGVRQAVFEHHAANPDMGYQMLFITLVGCHGRRPLAFGVRPGSDAIPR